MRMGSVNNYFQIVSSKWMPVFAVGGRILDRVQSTMCFSSDNLKMVWIAANSVFADVVNLGSYWNPTNKKFVNGGVNSFRFIVYRGPSVAIHQCSSPEPTTRRIENNT